MTSTQPTLLRLQTALSLHQAGKLAEAQSLYEEVLSVAPENFDAMHLLGVIALQHGEPARAFSLISTAIQLYPTNAAFHSNLGAALRELKQLSAAKASYDRAIDIKSDFVDAYIGRGNLLIDAKELEAAARDFRKAIAVDPHRAMTWVGLGRTLQSQRRFAEALEAFTRALNLSPHDVDALLGQGACLRAMGQSSAALTKFDAAIALDPASYDAYYNRALANSDLRRFETAVADYDRSVQLEPRFTAAYVNRAVSLLELKQLEAAASSCARAIELDPVLVEAHCNLGIVFHAMNQLDRAAACFETALRLSPRHPPTLYNRGLLLVRTRAYGRAVEDFRHAQREGSTEPSLSGSLLNAQIYICDWREFDQLLAACRAGLMRGERAVTPFQILAVSDRRGDALAAARVMMSSFNLSPARASKPLEARRPPPLRVGYVSADFRDHPCARLIVEAIERHDRTKITPIGVNIGLHDESEVGHRVRRAFSEFIDIAGSSDREAVEMIRALNLDIAVDMMGHTEQARPELFLSRPTPIQIGFLGFPGTTANPGIDYIVADSVVVGPGEDDDYTERVCRLPDSYLPTNPHLTFAVRPSRADVGLPDDAFVFASFNAAWKLSPTLFSVWMRLLQAIPQSVLWLSVDNDTARANLRREAVTRGVGVERLIFCGRVASHAAHLARQSCADLFLDTFPYNAHTTASEALLAGLPIVTLSGSTFASRVAASALAAIGAPDLITHSIEAYEALALRLAQDPSALVEVRRRIEVNGPTSRLFDVDRYVKHLEQAFDHMAAQHARGELPLSFDVANTAAEAT